MSKKSTKRYAMIDGIQMGTGVDSPEFEPNGVQCTKKEALSVREGLMSLGGKEFEDGTVLCYVGLRNSKSKSVMTVTLSRDKRRGESWFLNVKGNPGSVKTGDNTFGNLKIRTQIQYMFELVLKSLEKVGVNAKGIRTKVERGDVYVQSIAFAVYTSPLKNVDQLELLIDTWYRMYETRLTRGKRAISLLQELGIKRSTGDQFRNSIGLSIYNPSDRECKGNKLMHLCIYNKADEKREKGRLVEGSEEAEDLDTRARLDLTITNYYIKNKFGLSSVTIKNLYYEVRKRYDGKWRLAVQEFMDYAIKRTCLLYMFTCPNPFTADRKMLGLWRKGKTGRNWNKEIKEWGLDLGINVDVSPLAHLIMKQGIADMSTHTEEMATMFLTSDKLSKKYLERVADTIKCTRESRKLIKAVDKLKLDFSVPRY